MRFAPWLALTALFAASYVSARHHLARQTTSGDSKCFEVLVNLSMRNLADLFAYSLCVLMPQSLGLRSNVSTSYSRSLRKGLNAPLSSADILSGTGDRTVGWMAMYDIFDASWKPYPAFNIMVLVAGGVKCRDRRWSLSGRTRTVHSPCPSAPVLVTPCQRSTPIRRLSPQKTCLRAMYETNFFHSHGPRFLTKALYRYPGNRFVTQVCIHYAREWDPWIRIHHLGLWYHQPWFHLSQHRFFHALGYGSDFP